MRVLYDRTSGSSNDEKHPSRHIHGYRVSNFFGERKEYLDKYTSQIPSRLSALFPCLCRVGERTFSMVTPPLLPGERRLGTAIPSFRNGSFWKTSHLVL